MPSAEAYWHKIAGMHALRRCRWADPQELLATLAPLDVTSHRDLIRLFPNLSKPQQIACIRLFHLLKVRCAGPLLMTAWLSEEGNLRWAAKQALQEVKSLRAYKQLLAVIRSDSENERRVEACYILAFSFEDRLLEPLRGLYADEASPPALRATAAEGLANLLGYVDRRTRRYRQTLEPLLKGLRDPSPEVRFWTCFALGQMRAKEALPELERIAREDTDLCPNWWYVRDEAADAICHIFNKPTPDRECIHDSAR